jgi:hypothetical protein
MRTVSVGLCFCVLCGAAAVGAEPPASVTSTAATSPSTPMAYVEGLGRRVDAGTLAASTGGTDVSQDMTLNGTVSNNNADHVLTGANVISSGSFNGAAGVPMVIQNSGNNVLIQNATIINVQLQP